MSTVTPNQNPPTPPARPEIDINKTYTTRSGDPVRILCTDGPGQFPVIGLLEHHEAVECWTIHGDISLSGFHRDMDLVEAAPCADLAIDDPVLCCFSKEFSREWKKRYFAGVVDGQPTVWADGATSWSARAGSERIPVAEVKKVTL